MKQPLNLNNQQYCPWCSSKLKWNKDFAVCSSCGKHQFLNSRPCTAVLVENNHKILLLKRSIEPKLGLLDLPGGFVDIDDESIEQGALRELKEEVSLKLNQGALTYLASSLYNNYLYQGVRIPTMTSYFTASVTDQQAEHIRLDHENSEHIWVDIDRVNEHELAFETYWPIIDRFKALIKKRG